MGIWENTRDIQRFYFSIESTCLFAERCKKQFDWKIHCTLTNVETKIAIILQILVKKMTIIIKQIIQYETTQMQ